MYKNDDTAEKLEVSDMKMFCFLDAPADDIYCIRLAEILQFSVALAYLLCFTASGMI